jgi:uncharacterized membrane protein
MWFNYRMTRNPVLNAVSAVGYILLVALFISLAPQFIPEPTNPLAPIAGFLSLFVFSAAVMGYLIIGMPLRLFLEGEKKNAVELFVRTLLAFAITAALLFIVAMGIPEGVLGTWE